VETTDLLIHVRRVILRYLEQEGCAADPDFTRSLLDINEDLKKHGVDIGSLDADQSPG